MKKKVVSLLIAGLMMLEPCTMADAADLSDTEVIEQSVESAGDSVETEAMGETPEETGDIAESGAQDTEVSEEGSVDEEELSLDEGAEAVQDVNDKRDLEMEKKQIFLIMRKQLQMLALQSRNQGVCQIRSHGIFMTMESL